jgi:hypothetical protein
MLGFPSIAFTIFTVVLLSRTSGSVSRIPADPGYQYLQEAATEGIASLAFGDPYFHVATRGIAWLTTLFPLAWHALTLSMFVHFIWAACAVMIVDVLRREGSNNLLALLGGLLLVTAPHASESILGSVGSIKWPLLAAAITACASSSSIKNRSSSNVFLLLATGFTQPLTFLCILPMLDVARRDREARKNIALLAGFVTLTVVAQLLKVGLSSAPSGRSARISEPWDGMGAFWWSGLLGPIVVGMSVLLAFATKTIWVRPASRFAAILGIMAIVIAVVAYLLGGIADRYFVTPYSLASTAGLLALRDVRIRKRVWRIALYVMVGVGVLVPIVKWYTASWYLVGGPTWSSEIGQARIECSAKGKHVVQLSITAGSTVELDCEYVLRG